MDVEPTYQPEDKVGKVQGPTNFKAPSMGGRKGMRAKADASMRSPKAKLAGKLKGMGK